MKVLVIYRPNSEHGRQVDDFVRDYGRRYDAAQLELLSIDTREGSAMASMYDIMQYPALIALSHDGSPQRIWQDGNLPLMDEVASYARI